MCYGTSCPAEASNGGCTACRGLEPCRYVEAAVVGCASCAYNRDWSIEPEDAFEQAPCSTCRNASNYKEVA